LGNIYYRYKKYDIAKSYYLKAIDLSVDTTSVVVILNNLGAVEVEGGKSDSALFFLNEALRISKQHNDIYLCNMLNNFASLYRKKENYDSAFYYYRLSLNDARKNKDIEMEANNLYRLGKLFFEINKTDSALFYINLSNTIAAENNFQGVLADNYLILSKIEEAKGHKASALEYFKVYANLKDSVLNVDKFSDISQLQRLYEVSKTNQQIKQLVVEKQIKERTIYYQKIIQYIILIALFLMSIVLLVIIFQKRRLNAAYKILVEKNLKIIDLQENPAEKNTEKHKKIAIVHDVQNELLDRILTLMEDTSVICDTTFSITKLAVLVQSNHNYVSQVINTGLSKNFRSFLNSYRIREAQRIFSAPDAGKYTIESVALQVGFKSRSAFRDAFREITGVSPTFYLKSMKKQDKA